MSSSRPLIHCAASATLATAGLLLSSGLAAEPNAQRIEHYRASCLLTRPNAEVEACIQEAMAAPAAARQGDLQETPYDPYQRNALQRCEALPAADQQACEARMRGQGTASGSVEEGGILRELVIRERGGAAPAAPTTER